MQIHCKQCGADIPADDINIDRAIAKCRECNAVFSFASSFPDAVPAAARTQFKDNVAMPKAFVVDDWGTELKITRSWFDATAYFLVIFCLIWNGFLVIWYSIAFSEGILMMMLFPLLHVAVGLFLAYLCIATFVNKTVIHVNGGELTVKHGPVPWSGNRQLFTSEIEQLYCTEEMRRRKRGVSFTYTLHAILRDGSKLKLLQSLPEADHAFFLEHKLEDHLKIEDRPVRGEYR